MHKLRKIWRCASSEYVRWLLAPRQIIVAVLWVFNYVLAAEPLLARAEQMGEPVNLFEPLIAVGSSGMILLILPIVFLILISDFPRSKGNALFLIHRVGRRTWLTAQLLALLMMICTYIAAVALGAMLPVLGHCTISAEWSMVVTEYNVRFPDYAESYELLPENLYYQLKDIPTALAHTCGLLTLYLLLIGLILLAAALCGSRRTGSLTAGFLIAGGAALCSLRSPLMWLMPMAHSITWLHFTKYLRAAVMPLWGSYLLLGGGGILLVTAAHFAVKRFAFDAEEDI